MDLAAAAAEIRATRKSLLRAGWSSWRTWAGASPRQADRTTTRPSECGPTHQFNAWDSEPLTCYGCRGMGRVVVVSPLRLLVHVRPTFQAWGRTFESRSFLLRNALSREVRGELCIEQ